MDLNLNELSIKGKIIMKFFEQRKLAIELFNDVLLFETKNFIMDGNNCYKKIVLKLKPFQKEILQIIKNKDVPEEWTYYWAHWVGNKDIMIKKIKSEEWAFWWAHYIGNIETMRRIVYNPKKWEELFDSKFGK